MLALFEFFYGNIDINGLILKGFMNGVGIALDNPITPCRLPRQSRLYGTVPFGEDVGHYILGHINTSTCYRFLKGCRPWFCKENSHTERQGKPSPLRDCVIMMGESGFRQDRQSGSSVLECGRLKLWVIGLLRNLILFVSLEP